MMTRLRIAAFILCAALLPLLSGCFASDNPEKTHTSAFTPDSSPSSLYQQAASEIRTADSLSLYIGAMTNTTVGGQTFSKTSQQLLNLQNYGTNALQGSMEETIHIGSYAITVSEIYADGAGYFTVNGSPFSAPMRAEEYCARYAPAILFDTTLYSDIQAFTYGKTTGITFRQPSAGESWALPDSAEFTDAYGYAVLDSTGSLQESTYTVIYKHGAATISQTTRVIIRSTDTVQVKSPGTAEAYTPLEYLDAPRKLEQGCGYLLQATQIQANSTENIACQAFAISRIQTTSLSMSGTGDAFSALLDINVNQVNQSRGGEVTVIQQTERFQNGIYSISSNGGESVTNTFVDHQSMRTYCQDFLVESILLTEYITGASVTETETAYRITFQGSEALTEAICGDVCSTLYNDPDLLNNLASSYSTDATQCYLELDKHTGLPNASGLDYSATHTIEDITYRLTSQTEQAYQYE